MERPAGEGAAVTCPICNGRHFGAGPRGRSSPGGLAPRCLGCGSLERHRAHRVVFDAIRDRVCPGRHALQFSPDPSVEPAWFARYELSVFGTPSGLDLQAIDRGDGSTDAVIANHVLEHVADDRRALAEIVRILAPGGWAFLSVPDPLRMDRTVEYGLPRPDKHGHYRLYGPELAALLVQAMAPMTVLALTPSDPVTAEPDRAYFATRDAALAGDVAGLVGSAGVPVAPAG